MNIETSRLYPRVFVAAIGILATPLLALAAGPCHVAPPSNIGCEFYAVTLPNAFVDQTTFPFGIRVLNAVPGVTANLRRS
jgi:hypothetical protein